MALLFWLGIQPLLDHFSRLLTLSKEASFTERLGFNRDALHLFLDFPILGTGLGTFSSIFSAYKTGTRQWFVDFLHNDVFQFVTENGVLGTILAVFLLWPLLKKLTRSFSAPLSRQQQAYSFSVLTALLAWGIHSFTEFNFHIPANVLAFLSCMMLTVNLKITPVSPPQKIWFLASPFLILTSCLIIFLGHHSHFQRQLQEGKNLKGLFLKKEHWDHLVEQHPFFAEGHYQKGTYYFYQWVKTRSISDLETSLLSLNRAILKSPTRAAFHLRSGMARYYYARNQTDKKDSWPIATQALSELHRGVEFDRSNSLFWYFYGYYQLRKYVDYWEYEAEATQASALSALATALYFQPRLSFKIFTNVNTLTHQYENLRQLVLELEKIKGPSPIKTQRWINLHKDLAGFIKKNSNSINVMRIHPADESEAIELLEEARFRKEKKNWLEARRRYEEVLLLNTSLSLKIAAHLGLAEIGELTWPENN